MRLLFTIFPILFLSHVVKSQPLSIDSLHRILSSHANDTFRVNALNDLAFELRRNDAALAKKYASEAKKLSLKLSFDRGYVTSLVRLGAIAIYQEEYNEAESLFLQVLKEEKEDNYLYGIARAESQLSTVYREKEDYPRALTHCKEALRIFEKIDKEDLVGMMADNLGVIYKNMGDYENALRYMHKCLKIRQQLNDTDNLGFSYMNIGNLHLAMEQYSKALEYLERSEKIFRDLHDDYDLAKTFTNLGTVHFKLNDLDKALHYYLKARSIKTKLGVAEKDPIIFNNIGSIYHQRNDLDEALRYYLICIEIQENEAFGGQLLDAYYNAASVYYRKKDYQRAIEFYQIALEMAEKSERKISELDILKYLANAHGFLGNFEEANAFNTRYIELSDKLEKNYREAVILNEQFNEEEKKYQLLQKDQEITKINLDRSRAQNKLQRLTIYSLIGGMILLLFLLLAIYRYWKQRQLRHSAEEATREERQKIADLLKNQEVRSLNAMLDGQEEERRRIAQDLHDRLGSILSMVKIHFSSVEKNIEELRSSNSEQYEKANSLLDEACEEVRKIAHNMASGVLDKFGLIAALDDLSETLNQSGNIRMDLLTHGLGERLPREMEIELYRIIQELISNVLKHAQAKEVTIQLLQSRDYLNVTVEDDGKGFVTESGDSAGMGLKSIASRVEKLKGEFTIDSAPGKGTIATFDIPLP